MSGILDNKSRVIDAILTYEGRRQMAEGTFTIKNATFSDSYVVYKKDLDEGHEDPTNKIYLEAFNVPQDQIVFEADDSGNLIPFRQHSAINPSSNDQVASWTSFVNGKIKFRSISGSFSEESVYGADFASQIEGILSSSVDNFKKLRVIGTADSLFDDEEFAISPNEVTFNIKNDVESLKMFAPTSINTIDSLFNDEKLRNVDNFKYLPPIIKTNSLSLDKKNIKALKEADLLLGDYPAWGPEKKLEFPEIKKELEKYESSSKVIFFDPTSRDNEIVSQFFEITNDSAKKLDVIDYGRVTDNSVNATASSHHVFFIGKVLVDDYGSDCFIHLFTLLFSSVEEE